MRGHGSDGPASVTGDVKPEPPRGLAKLFRTTLIMIPIGVLGNIVFSLAVTDRALLASLHEFPRAYLALAIGLGLLPWLTNTLRLLIWARFLGHDLSFRESFQMTLAVDLGSAISPTAVGGGFFKWGMLVQRGVSPGTAASLTTFPIIEDGIFFAIALPVAVVMTASWDLPVFRLVAEQFRADAPVVLLSAAGIALLTWLAVRWILLGGLGHRTRQKGIQFLARARRKLRDTWRDARAVFRLIAVRGRWRFALSLSLTALQWSARYSVISALAAFLGAPVQPVLFWLLQWVVFTLMAFIPTPGATGGAEAAFYLIYSAFLPDRVIGIATAGWRFFTFYFQLGLASVLFFILNLRSGGVPMPVAPENRTGDPPPAAPGRSD
jgi:glycosyltransferase 2 family protein